LWGWVGFAAALKRGDASPIGLAAWIGRDPLSMPNRLDPNMQEMVRSRRPARSVAAETLTSRCLCCGGCKRSIETFERGETPAGSGSTACRMGQPYDVRLVSFRAMKEPAHLALHPFGQIPTYEEGELGLFETGAIVFHIAQRHAGLLPDDANARARAITWMFAALSTVSRRSLNSEPPRSWRATNPGPRNACLSSRIASVTGWANFPVVLAMPTGSMVRSARVT
jgi:glutathione S-transferase-like protein